MKINIDITGQASDELAELQGRLLDGAGLHARIAGEAEKFIKERGRETAATEHDTATRLGARPTGHLEQAYQDIASESDGSSASLQVPRASRLRAAFGGYLVTPGPGKQFLTIPWDSESYGKRAGEFGVGALEFSRELVKFRNGETGFAPVLIKAGTGKGGSVAEVMYLLCRKANIPGDAGLIPFDDLAEHAAIDAELWLLEERGVA